MRMSNLLWWSPKSRQITHTHGLPVRSEIHIKYLYNHGTNTKQEIEAIRHQDMWIRGVSRLQDIGKQWELLRLAAVDYDFDVHYTIS